MNKQPFQHAFIIFKVIILLFAGAFGLPIAIPEPDAKAQAPRYAQLPSWWSGFGRYGEAPGFRRLNASIGRGPYDGNLRQGK